MLLVRAASAYEEDCLSLWTRVLMRMCVVVVVVG